MNLLSDLKYAMRLLRKSPAFTLLSTLLVAVGLGITLVVFNLANNMYFKSPSFPNGDRYVSIVGVDKTMGLAASDLLDNTIFQLISDRNQSYQVLGAVRFWNSATISDGDSAQIFNAAAITPQLLELTGVNPLLGRSLSPEDSLTGAEAVVLLGHDVWQGYYNSRSDIVGQYSRINGQQHTIIGVMPPGYTFPSHHELWLPRQIAGSVQPGEGKTTPIALLKEGVSLQQAQSELNAIMADLTEQYPQLYTNLGAKVVPYIGIYDANGEVFGSLYLFLCFAILLLACINVGSLILVRAGERTQELAIRSSLGGTRWRIARQALIEPFLVCLGGGLLGLGLAHYGIKFLGLGWKGLFNGGNLPFWMDFSLDADTLLAAVLIITVIWLSAGGFSAWRVSRLDLNKVLGGFSKGSAIRGSSKFSAIVVSIELIFSFQLLIIVGAMTLGFRILLQTDYGVARENYLTAEIILSGSAYQSSAARYQYYQNLQQELALESGIEYSTLTSTLPSGRGTPMTFFGLEDRDLRNNGLFPSQYLLSIASNYFTALEVPILQGRSFNDADNLDSTPVVIIDQTFARSTWPDQSALGKRIQLRPDSAEESSWLTVIGVVPHIINAQAVAGAGKLSSFYQPLAQVTPYYMKVVIKVPNDPNSYRAQLISASTRADRDIALRSIKPLDEVLDHSLLGQKLLSTEFMWVSWVVLVLAITGIFGLISRAVLSRTQEIGIRRALGASRSHIIGMYLGQASLYLLIGLIVGGGTGVLFVYGGASILPEILDAIAPIAIGVTTLLVILVLGASYLPVRRVIKMEPGTALRYD